MLYVDEKYIKLLGSQLAEFKKKSARLWNFRCPFCGDSQRNKYKARGYVFALKQSLLFKCHNCNESHSLGKLIKRVDPTLYKQYILEKFKNKDSGCTVTVSEPVYKFVSPMFAVNQVKEMDMVYWNSMLSIGVVPLYALGEDHPANIFCLERKLPYDRARKLYFIDDEEKLEGMSPKYKDRIAGHAPRILLPFCDLNGSLVGLSGRAIDDSRLRYLTLRFDNSEGSQIFGLEKWDYEKHTYVVEGQFDSFFLPNCLAVGCSDMRKIGNLLDQDHTTIVLDNEPRNPNIVAQMSKCIRNGWSVCIWSERIKQKDINDMVLGGMDADAILDSINRNTSKGLQAEFALNNWKRC